MNISFFKDNKFIDAVKQLFKDLNVPINYVTDSPAQPQDILKETYKDNETFRLIEDVYFVGMIDDAAFENRESENIETIKSDYDGILVFGVILKERQNGLLPTRSQLAEIARSFNREFYYTPVVVLFKYNNHIAFANTERLKYKQEWREGEKVGKVSLLRDIDIVNPHTGHLQILNELKIPTSGSKRISTFAELYTYWQEVFSVNLLNKKFYQELSNWYFWAVKQVTFPGKPTELEAISKGVELGDLIQEHNATNVIRLLTRLLFTWFIKEKKLIPEELFDLDTLQKDILSGIEPYHQDGLFNQTNLDSVYYKAILQNLFFATLNCPIKSDSVDNRSRGFRGEAYGQHRGIDYLMRYKKYFKSPDAFLELMNNTVPFLNGGLFECLDDKDNNIFIDGFSDNLTNGHKLIVPDYLFFGTSEEVDLSVEYGVNNNTAKRAAVKGLINILKSYKFTIAENTPIEEDVALDPELLGRVFENLLASYNPETKSTARKQTGSFYTPREIVNYMVDESLIAYLKSSIKDWKSIDDNEVDEKLQQLVSFSELVPFLDNTELKEQIVTALSNCTILDPACGSGAFPMGILQKMVHILQKLDPENSIWEKIQRNRAISASQDAFRDIKDGTTREEVLREINNAFDKNINDPDYARKLYLIENCIYGVDIQPIATQISKLRFFISLVVEQKVNSEEINFGIRSLPNLETKFVTANTLIGIDKPDTQLTLFETEEIKQLESELKIVRKKLFSARSKNTKQKYRIRDKELRVNIAEELKKSGWASTSAQQLSDWDPYDQNASSPFFDPEWMFDIKEGFDIVIGNPPYGVSFSNEEKILLKSLYPESEFKIDSFSLFILKGLNTSKISGYLMFIIPSTFMDNYYEEKVRKKILNDHKLDLLVELDDKVFETVTVHSLILGIENTKSRPDYLIRTSSSKELTKKFVEIPKSFFSEQTQTIFAVRNFTYRDLLSKLYNQYTEFKSIIDLRQAIKSGNDKEFITREKLSENYKPILGGKHIQKWKINSPHLYINYGKHLACPRDPQIFEQPKIILREAGNKIIATIDEENYYIMSSLYNGILINSNFKIKYILAVLNSDIFQFLMNLQTFSKTSGAFTKAKIYHYYQLPIKNIDNGKQELLERVVNIIILSAKHNMLPALNFFEEINNAILFEFYLPEEINLANKNIFGYIKDLKSFSSDMIEEEKLAIIQSEYGRLSNSSYPVKHLLDTLNEVDEVRIIRASL